MKTKTTSESIVLTQVRVQNAFGIKATKIDFRLKNIQKDKYDFSDQIIEVGDETISMVPTFLGKNATGKTSLIKAITFAMNLSNKESFIRTVTHYGETIFRHIYFANKDENYYFNPINFLKMMYKQVVFAGAKAMQIELIFTNNNNVLIELTPSSFDVKINEKVINVIWILKELFIENLANKTRLELYDYFRRIIESKVSNFIFLPITNKSLFRDTHYITSVNEIFLKNSAQDFLFKISKKIGYKGLSFLLRKIDNKIGNVLYDPKSKSLGIHMKDTNGASISPTNLSFGTIKTIEILAKSIEIFETGGIFLIDEIENGLHLSLIKLILAFYTSDEINSKNCQIILTTHNPLIFKQQIVNNFNAFIFENDNFVNIKKHTTLKRSEDQKGLVDPKNYYNDYYWKLRKVDSHTTISDLAIDKVVMNIVASYERPKSKSIKN